MKQGVQVSISLIAIRSLDSEIPSYVEQLFLLLYRVS